ncbi:TTL domain-containing protein [Durotheca rogersii]|uniref:TTL domain-containing protein n=1 Tax=Durotheca rogersii TaxID=419775 RepID=UPI002220B607|nr:TTL domain-containing protein [Durotheca rogersii]KAI5861963.1 TTL domain-containing protein [Durotheca rogersii]
MHVFVQAASPWLDEHLRRFIRKHVPESVFYDDFDDFPKDAKTTFQFCDGWALNRNFAVVNSADKALINAYPSSDALARKDYLSRVVEYWTAKTPDSILKTHSPLTVRLSLDYAEYVDEALTAADDLTLLYSLEENENKPPEEREWWILKPALVDCGAGIRLFSTLEELASHLELAEYEDDDEDDDDDDDNDESDGVLGREETRSSGKPTPDSELDTTNEPSPCLAFPILNSLDGLVTAVGDMKLDAAPLGAVRAPKKQPYVFKEGGRIPSSEMREFVAQRYITAIAALEKRKWHVRAYVLSIGRLKVHVFNEMLALLALEDYEPPWLNPSLKSSLTNTGLQDEEDFLRMGSMRDFWAIPDDLLPGDAKEGKTWKECVFDQICNVSAELFRGAAHTMADKFTTLDKCFELFGVDFLVDEDGTAWLLEVNESPAFYHQGVAGPIALRLMESLILVALEHMGLVPPGETENEAVRKRMIEVLDETNKLAKSNITEITPE